MHLPLNLEAFTAAIQAGAAEYEKIELKTLYLPYLDGEEELPGTAGYILDGAQMQD